MQKPVCAFIVYLFLISRPAGAESFRASVAGKVEVSIDNPGGVSIPLGISGSAVITLGEDRRFFRGIELELSGPQLWLSYPGSMAMLIYAELDHIPPAGIADLEGRRIAYEPLPNKLRSVYQVSLRSPSGLRTTPYATVVPGVTRPSSFPLLFRLMPIIKGLSEELESLKFQLTVKPVLSDEGAVKMSFRYPDQLRGKPFTLLIDDAMAENLNEERLIKEGEHHLVILSEDYRNESRRFVVERAKTLDLIIELKDPTPLIIFERPQNARIFLDNVPVVRETEPVPVEPGIHEAKFQVGDYTIIKTLTIQRGKTYRVALAVDITVQESD
ncbi:MAG: hypothetical protein LBD48_03765 [Treponema sp.]|jgi:hypothetical protein|nr:hypothetical protein [Treponema sp.]